MKGARPKKKRAAISRTRRRSPVREPASESAAWIRELATPYLKGYLPIAASESGLRGYWFLASRSSSSLAISDSRSASHRRSNSQAAGFFVGYLVDGADFSFLRPEPPECLVFAGIRPVGGRLHKRLAAEPDSLLRKTFEYIRWLTHRPPRFVFHEHELPAMARHWPMGTWPIEKQKHLSRNFFIETLAWLVRSGLVRKLKEEAARS
ncbi:MAG TPA: hypothetical protein VGR81_08495 [Candidatus Acidoferrales bacterium]|nr:hypothetical protein [Candidatus Acidoferrales bacterium]